MKKTQFLMGNEAIARGAIHAGVDLVAGYPGTPSTEILETAAKLGGGRFYVEWSVNEKAALEVAAGASYSGARTLVTMKQVGLNVASDPLMSLSYVGVEGGMVIVSADDPGPISSQTEQDTRRFAGFAKVPCFDPSSPEEAYAMVSAAFELSEKYRTPVFLRPTTRVCHGCASVEVDDDYPTHDVKGFVKDTNRFVIFPRTSYLNHIRLEERVKPMSDELSDSPFNTLEGDGRLGIACGGISYTYVKEAIESLGIADKFTLFKVGTPYPFPEKKALEFMSRVDKILAIEELDPTIERELLVLAGAHKIPLEIRGKLTGDSPLAGENSVEIVTDMLAKLAGIALKKATPSEAHALPIRPPVLCAGCPHRASFYAVKVAMKGKKATFSGDIGCYTLGNAKPLDMVDTCLCMGAGITISQGLKRVNDDTTAFAFVGDSTFFASGLTGIVNAVYNRANVTVMLLDNSITAMTGGQPHPGTGMRMMGDIGGKVSIEKVLEGIGVDKIAVVNPFELENTVATVKEISALEGVKVIICRAPCINLVRSKPALVVNDKCVGCKRCVNEIGCPALVVSGKKVEISASLCTGCGLCAQLCPTKAITEVTK